jgi:hypothetical protein
MMKITKDQLEDMIFEIIQEVSYNSMSPAGKGLANSIKRKFMRLYPDAKVGIDGRGGFITVNGKKALDMSQATSTRMSDEEMIEKMHSVYAMTHVDNDVGAEARRGARPGEIALDFGKDIGTYNYIDEGHMKITKSELRRIIKEEATRIEEEMQAQESGGASTSDLKNWFNEKRANVQDLKIPTTQIRSLIDAMEDVLAAAQSGRLKAKGDYLGKIVDKISGTKEPQA